LTSATKLGTAGCVIGLAGAAAASHLFRSLLFNISPFDPLVLALAVTLVLFLACLAALLPAMRASLIEPMKALRTD
jgi:ABC-type lipoprotein release transport system permease subunit